MEDALAVKAQLIAEVEGAAGSRTHGIGQPTLGDFIESWLQRKIARGDLEDSTAERYANDLGHLSERLLSMPIDRVTPDDIELWMIASREGYSARTINGWRRTLRTALNAAPGLAVNPAAKVRPLKEAVNLEEPNALRPNELRRLLCALEAGDRIIHLAALTQALTGLRWGEVSALMWSDLDADERILVIRRKAVKGKLKPTTKTNRGRIVGLPGRIVGELEGLRQWLEQTRHPGRFSGLLFPSGKGTPISSGRISAELRKARQRAGIGQRFTSHGLRRSMTDMLRMARVDPVIAKAIVGHSTDAMRQHYSTLDPAETREAADAVGVLLLGDEPPGEAAE